MQDAASSLPSGRALNEQEAPRSSLPESGDSALPRAPLCPGVEGFVSGGHLAAVLEKHQLRDPRRDGASAAPSDGGSAEDESPADEALRSLACWLGAGGYNAPSVDAKVFEEKIRWGVENACKEAVAMDRDLARYRWLRVRGAAFDGDPTRRLEDGLVYRVGNLDDAIDREMAVAHSSQARDQLSVNAGTARTDGPRPDGQGEAS